MKKGIKKVLSVFMACVLMMSSIIGFGITSFAESSDPSQEEPRGPLTYYVRTESELRNAIYDSVSGDTIVFLNDIVATGNRCIYFGHKLTIDLNYHCLTFGGKCAGMQIDSSICLYNGTIYGHNDIDYAIWIYGGSPKISNCSIYAGNCIGSERAYGNAIYCNAHSSTIYLDYVYLQGGNGYTKGIFTPERTGKAIYVDWSGSRVCAVGRGYTCVDGQPA